MLNDLSRNPEIGNFPVHVFVDGPRNSAEAPIVRETIRVASAFVGSKSLTVKSSPRNMGLAQSVSQGLDELFREHGALIVLEDDLGLGKTFLKFMEDGLEKFALDHRVATVQGYVYPVPYAGEAFFLRGAGSWGWATWRDRWENREQDSTKILQRLNAASFRRDVDFEGNYVYSKMLEMQVKGEIDSWAVPWHVQLFIDGKLSLFPGKSLVQNRGMDGTGTHDGISSRSSFDVVAVEDTFEVDNLQVAESQTFRNLLIEFYRRNKSVRWRLEGLMRRFVNIARDKV